MLEATVTLEVPAFPSLVAVMVALPVPAAVTVPDAFTVATDMLDEVQMTDRPVSVLPAASRSAALSAWVPPWPRLTGDGLTVKQIADLGRLAWKARGIELPDDPDVAALAIDLGMACFRRSVFAHGAITAPYRDAAAQVMVDFLEPFVEGAKSPQSASP